MEKPDLVFLIPEALESEFLTIQLKKIPRAILAVWKLTMLSKEKQPLGKLKSEKLSRVMLGILTFPHSTAAGESIFILFSSN